MMGSPVMNARVVRRAMEFAAALDLPLIEHCEDLQLSAGGDMHEGHESTRLGLRGIPRSSEDVMVARDIILAELTGVRYHVAHISSKTFGGDGRLCKTTRIDGSLQKPRRITSCWRMRICGHTTAITK